MVMHKSSMRLAAIYTTFRPDSGFNSRIKAMMQQCEMIVIVDNTPGGHIFNGEVFEKCHIIQDGINKGLGSALNIGVNYAKDQGATTVVLFDQDSTPEVGFIISLLEGLAQAGPKAIVGPCLIDDKLSNDIEKTSLIDSRLLLEVKSCIPTSGMCFNISLIPVDAKFSEDLFLDFVDFDWCWRFRKDGWNICEIKNLKMPHRLGLEQKKFFFLTYHVPSPFRHYFQFRDGLNLMKMSHVPLYGKLRFSLILVPKILIYPFILDNGFLRFKWMVAGIKDSFMGVGGIGLAEKLLNK